MSLNAIWNTEIAPLIRQLEAKGYGVSNGADQNGLNFYIYGKNGKKVKDWKALCALSLDQFKLKAQALIDQAPHLFDEIEPGDMVTILIPTNKRRTGRAVMYSPDVGGWVLTIGKWGRTALATRSNVIDVRSG